MSDKERQDRPSASQFETIDAVPLSVSDVLASRISTPWYKNSQLRKLYLTLIPGCLFVSANNGFDGSMLNGLQSLDSWESEFNHPKGAILGIISAAYALGAVISTPISPMISDRFGRRWAIFIGSFVMLIGVALQASAKENTGWFVAARMVLGLGVTASLSSAPVLIAELSHPKDRAVFTALFNTTFYLGSIGASWTTYGTFRIANSWAWRIPSILQGAPALCTILAVLFLPESPRWYLSKDRSELALKTLADCHANGDTQDELVRAEFWEISETLRLEKEAAKDGIKQLWATPGNRKRLTIVISIGLFGQWTGNGLISYYLAKILKSIGIVSQERQTLINGILTIVNYFVAIFAAVVVNRIRRRTMWLGSTVAMLFTFTALAVSLAMYTKNANSAAANSALAFVFLFNFSYNFAWNPLPYLYAIEILPYRIRTMGMGVLIFFNKGALCFNQFVNPIGLDSLGWKYYLIYVAFLAFMFLFIFFLYPETSGYTLEEVSVVFDGPQARSAFASEKLRERDGDGVSSVSCEARRKA